MTRVKSTDATQAWFWSPNWQLGEREADADRSAGRVEIFESSEQFVSALRANSKQAKSAPPR